MNSAVIRGLLGSLAAGAFLLAAPASAQDPYAEPDNSWITLDGTVESVMADAFTLDYGDGVVTVEMDDGDRDADGYKLVQGDKVSVSGLVDDDFFESTTIEASSVYVESIGTYFYASAIDEEDPFVVTLGPVVPSRAVVRGTVTSVSDEEFTLSSGAGDITVEVEEMAYNPLDETGYQQIEVGDYVSVTGDMDYDLFEGRELVADHVTTINDLDVTGRR